MDSKRPDLDQQIKAAALLSEDKDERFRNAERRLAEFKTQRSKIENELARLSKEYRETEHSMVSSVSVGGKLNVDRLKRSQEKLDDLQSEMKIISAVIERSEAELQATRKTIAKELMLSNGTLLARAIESLNQSLQALRPSIKTVESAAALGFLSNGSVSIDTHRLASSLRNLTTIIEDLHSHEEEKKKCIAELNEIFKRGSHA